MFREEISGGIHELSHKRVECPDGSDYNNHTHSYCEILLFICGNADFCIDGRVYSPRPYDLLLIPETKYHYLVPKDKIPYENYVIAFDRELVGDDRCSRIFDKDHVVSIREDSELRSFFTRLDRYRELYTGKDFAESSSLLVRELLIYLSHFEKNSVEKQLPGNKQIPDIIDIIDQSLTEKLDAGIIAKKLFLSRSYVQNIFSKVMHIGLKQYIVQRKIFASDADLKSGMSPASVAEKYAFEDYSSFYRAYKRVLGVSPRNGGKRDRS